MRKIYKYLAALLFALALSMATSKPAEAQGYPTMDIANLIQGIIHDSEEWIREGSTMLSGVTKMADLAEKVEKARQIVARARQIAAIVGAASQLASDITAIAQLAVIVAKDIEKFSNMSDFLANMSPFDMVATIKNQALGYMKIANMLIKRYQNLMQQYMSINKDEPMSLFSMIHQIVQNLYMAYYALRANFQSRYYSTYVAIIRRMNANKEAFIQQMMFY